MDFKEPAFRRRRDAGKLQSVKPLPEELNHSGPRMAMAVAKARVFDVINDGGLAPQSGGGHEGAYCAARALAFDSLPAWRSLRRNVSAGLTTSVISKL